MGKITRIRGVIAVFAIASATVMIFERKNNSHQPADEKREMEKSGVCVCVCNLKICAVCAFTDSHVAPAVLSIRLSILHRYVLWCSPVPACLCVCVCALFFH